jgi:hypothetical protein
MPDGAAGQGNIGLCCGIAFDVTDIEVTTA